MTTTLDDFSRRLRELGEPQKRKALVRQRLTKAGLRGESLAKRLVTTRLKRRSGNLVNSIRHEIVESGTGQVSLVLTAGRLQSGRILPYARIQEQGGTVRPQRARYLSIPIHPDVLTGTGVSRFSSPRDVPVPLTFIVSKKGSRLLINAETGEPYYVLKRQVSITGRHFMRSTLRHLARTMPEEIVQDVVNALVEG